MAVLAINGGKPIRRKLFPAYNTIGSEEELAVTKVLRSGNLSQFLGAWHKDFYGGPQIRELESQWAEVFNTRKAISVNSATSGLYAAIGAIGIKPGDEVIVSPYTMSASAIAPIIYGGVPVFADVDCENYGLSPESVESCITSRTKAIILVHIFGNPARLHEILAIAKKHNIIVIEDCAQAPLATYHDRFVGTYGDIGVYSLNYHKHIHTGEGGIVVTDDEALAQRLYLIRNHGENSLEPSRDAFGGMDGYNTFGFNFRMTEIEASIAIEQLKKLPRLIKERISNAAIFADELGKLPGIIPPVVESFSEHVYYQQPFKFKAEVVGVSRNAFVDAVKAEIPSAVLREDTPLINAGYVKPLYLLPLFQERLSHCAFNCDRYQGNVKYRLGMCPIVERLHYHELFAHEYMRPGMTGDDINDVLSAFYKVYENLDELRERHGK